MLWQTTILWFIVWKWYDLVSDFRMHRDWNMRLGQAMQAVRPANKPGSCKRMHAELQADDWEFLKRHIRIVPRVAPLSVGSSCSSSHIVGAFSMELLSLK